MKHILHIDTSTDTAVVAISGDGQMLKSATNQEARNHASTINSMVEQVLQELQLSLNSLSAISVVGGPGSYTGLRIGLATAKGFCYALDIPLLQHNKLEILAYQEMEHTNHTVCGAMIAARPDEYFFGLYDKEHILVEPEHVMADKLFNTLYNYNIQLRIVGIFNEEKFKNCKFSNVEFNENQEINLDFWLKYTFKKYNSNNFVNLSSAEPFYLKQVYTHK